MKTEIKVLTTRREFYRKKLDNIDDEFTDFIESESVSEVLKKKLEEEWVKHTTENNIKIDSAWQNNIKGKERSIPKR